MYPMITVTSKLFGYPHSTEIFPLIEDASLSFFNYYSISYTSWSMCNPTHPELCIRRKIRTARASHLSALVICCQYNKSDNGQPSYRSTICGQTVLPRMTVHAVSSPHTMKIKLRSLSLLKSQSLPMQSVAASKWPLALLLDSAM